MKHWRNETSGTLSQAVQRFIGGAEPQEGDQKMLEAYRAVNAGVPDEVLFQGRGLDGEQWSIVGPLVAGVDSGTSDPPEGPDTAEEDDLGERAGDAAAAEPPPPEKRKPPVTPHNKLYEPENKGGKKSARRRK